MSEPTVTPPAPPAAPPAKKGLSPLAWVLIGCLGVIVIAMLIVGACTMFVAKKGKEMVGDFEKNPAMATAEMMVKLNPELELVDSDEDAGTLTVRNKKTGEEVTVNLDEVKEGRISFGTKEGDYTLGVTGSEETGEGALTVTGPNGDTQLKFGAGAGAGDRPDWVPVYPGTEPTSNYSANVGGASSGAFTMVTDDSVADVIAYYEETLGDDGFGVQKSTFSGPGGDGGSVSGETTDPKRTVAVMITHAEDQTQAVVTYSEGQ